MKTVALILVVLGALLVVVPFLAFVANGVPGGSVPVVGAIFLVGGLVLDQLVKRPPSG
jgi:uncharacterized membrane protein